MLQDDNSKIFPEGTDDRLDELAANAGDDEEMSFASLIDEIVYVVKNEVAECENKNFIVCKGCTAEKLEGVTFNEKEQDFEAWCMDAGKFKKQVKLPLLRPDLLLRWKLYLDSMKPCFDRWSFCKTLLYLGSIMQVSFKDGPMALQAPVNHDDWMASGIKQPRVCNIETATDFIKKLLLGQLTSPDIAWYKGFSRVVLMFDRELSGQIHDLQVHPGKLSDITQT